LELPQYLKEKFPKALSGQLGATLFQNIEVLLEKELRKKLNQQHKKPCVYH